MSLSNELISQFVKATKDDRKTNTEATVNGTVVSYGGKTYVKLDGSDLLTPVRTTTDVKDDERVTVLIKDHTATITGNMSSPAARTDDVKEVADQITEFEIMVSHRVSTDELEAINAVIQKLRVDLARVDELHAVFADIETLESKFANVEYLNAKDIEAINANIEKIQAHVGTFEDLSAEELEVVNAEIQKLRGYSADFTYVSADVLEAIKASIKDLSVENLNAQYANVDFANINEAAFRKIFSDSGIIKDLIVSNGTITGELVGVTLKGDLIEAGTLKADKLVVKGSDGLYYKLNIEAGAVESAEVTKEELQNGLHGTAIIAKTITAEKIAVNDLVAFGATIGGFQIKDHAIHSGVKESVHNSTRGLYMDDDGQLALGDSNNYLKYYKKDPNETNSPYRLELKLSEKLGARNLIRNSDSLIFEGYYFQDENDTELAVLGDAILGTMILGKEG